MKKTYLLLSCLFMIAGAVSAQTGNAVIFTELGENFTAYLNGEKQNEAPSNNVKINDLTSEFYQIRIDFEDEALPDFHNNNFAIQFGQVTTYMIKPSKKGKYVIRFGGSSAISSSTAADKPAPVQSRPAVQSTQAVETTPAVTHDVQVTETKMTTKTTAPNGESINVDMNVGETGISISMDIPDMDMDMDMTHTEETHMSTEVSSTGSLSRPATDQPEEIVVVTGNCASPMSDSDFRDAATSISGKDFEDSKMAIAKQIAKGKCLTSAQVRDIMQMFDFEETKLDFAKFAFDYTFDTDNYYKVNDAFDFEMTIEELQEFLETK